MAVTAGQEYRITGPNFTSDGESTNPPSFEIPLDAARCAKLHNALIQRLLQQNGRDIANLEGKTWWDCFGSEIESPETKFHPAVIDFLQSAWYCWQGVSGPLLSDRTSHVFWGIKGIPESERMFDNGIADAYVGMDTLDRSEFDGGDEEDYTDDDDLPPESPTLEEEQHPHDEQPLYHEKFRFVTLYQSAAEMLDDCEPIGVVFDQRQHMAVFVSSKAEVAGSLDMLRTWSPLEEILDLWHGTIDQGKVVAVDGAWQMQPLAPDDLSNTLRAWHELIAEIESRMPSAETTAPFSGSTEYLLDQRNAEELGLSGFIRHFLTAARRPRFRFVAPGLAIPSESQLINQIQQSRDIRLNPSADAIRSARPPLLLFPIIMDMTSNSSSAGQGSRTLLSQQVDLNDDRSERLFPYATKSISPEATFSPGLYLSFTNSEKHPYEDSFRLVLPYTLGAGARTSSLDEIQNRYAELYQIGYDVYGGGTGGHDAQLAPLFDRWIRKLHETFGRFTRGWGVERDGVDGIEDDGDFKGVEIFKNAEDGALYAQYCLPSTLMLHRKWFQQQAARREGTS